MLLHYIRRIRLVFVCFVSFTQLLTGCSDIKPNDASSSNPSLTTSQQELTILFPLQQKGGYHDAKLQGELKLIDNCLYLEEASTGRKYVLIWPHDFSYHVEGKTIQVLNGEKDVLVKTGQHIWVSGGEYPLYVTPDSIPADSNCTGPYWGVGLEAGVVTDK